LDSKRLKGGHWSFSIQTGKAVGKELIGEKKRCSRRRNQQKPKPTAEAQVAGKKEKSWWKKVPVHPKKKKRKSQELSRRGKCTNSFEAGE